MEESNSIMFHVVDIFSLLVTFLIYVWAEKLSFGTDGLLGKAITMAVIIIVFTYPWKFVGSVLIIDSKGVLVKREASALSFNDKYMEFGNISRVVVNRTLYGRRVKFYSDKGTASAYPKHVDAVVNCLRNKGVQVVGWQNNGTK